MTACGQIDQDKEVVVGAFLDLLAKDIEERSTALKSLPEETYSYMAEIAANRKAGRSGSRNGSVAV